MPRIVIERIPSDLPSDIGPLRDEARREGFGLMDRLAGEWQSGEQRFTREGEAVFAARCDGMLAGIGGVTTEPAVAGALRMRRFYVRPAYRRLGIARRLAEAILATAPRGHLITVNAGTPDAPAFWEALGFTAAPRDGYTHIRTRATTSP